MIRVITSKKFYLFIWLCQSLLWQAGRFIFVAACGIFSFGMQDLGSWPGIEPWPFALGVWSLSHWTARGIPIGISWCHFCVIFRTGCACVVLGLGHVYTWRMRVEAELGACWVGSYLSTLMGDSRCRSSWDLKRKSHTKCFCFYIFFT